MLQIITKFIKDVFSTLYETDNYMSLPRLIFMCNFILFIYCIVAQLGTEYCSIVMTSLGVTGAGFVGNKFITHRGKPNGE